MTTAEKVFKKDKFIGEAKFSLLRVALEEEPFLRQIILFRIAKDYEDVEWYFIEYPDNRKMMVTLCSNLAKAKSSVKSRKQPQDDVRMDELRREM